MSKQQFAQRLCASSDLFHHPGRQPSASVNFIVAHDGSNRPYPEIGVPDGHHNLSHHDGDEQKKAKIAWNALIRGRYFKQVRVSELRIDEMLERIEAGLKSRFRQHPAVRQALPEIHTQVRAGTLAASVAARRLLDLLN